MHLDVKDSHIIGSLEGRENLSFVAILDENPNKIFTRKTALSVIFYHELPEYRQLNNKFPFWMIIAQKYQIRLQSNPNMLSRARQLKSEVKIN